MTDEKKIVSRLVHFLRLHLVGRRIGKVSAPDDAAIFGKAGTSGPEFEAAVRGKKVVKDFEMLSLRLLFARVAE